MYSASANRSEIICKELHSNRQLKNRFRKAVLSNPKIALRLTAFFVFQNLSMLAHAFLV